MNKINKLLWASIILIVLVDILSYFFADTTTIINIQLILFIILLISVLLLILSLKDLIKKNKKGAIIGFIIGFILGALSYGTGMFLLFFLIPIYALIGSLVSCGGESCWSWYIILSPIILGFTGLLIGVYLQNKNMSKK